MVTIRVVGSPTILSSALGVTLFEALQRGSVPVGTSCGGRAACGMCRVTVLRGAECLSPILPEEITHLGSVAKIVGTRLSCQARLVADGEIELEVPEAVDVAARKRDKARRHALARNSAPRTRASTDRTATVPQRRSEPGEPNGEQVEWRPRKLSST
jgi:ferredoxin, 2Fe-2S